MILRLRFAGGGASASADGLGLLARGALGGTLSEKTAGEPIVPDVAGLSPLEAAVSQCEPTLSPLEAAVWR